MADEKEQLRIEAELDTSKLKQDAKKGFSDVSNEAKKLQTESKNTSKTIDGIGEVGKDVGRAMQSSAQQSTSALKTISSEAKATEKSLNDVARATKEIKFRQGIGLAARAVSELAPVGQMAGKAMGMSDKSVSMVGAGISGAMAGAQVGAVLGPLGAAGGALIGAATSLVGAASKLKEAAEAQFANLDSTKKGIATRREEEAFNIKVRTGSTDELEGMLEKERGKLQKYDMNISHFEYKTPENGEEAAQIAERLQSLEEKRANTLRRIAQLETEISRQKEKQEAEQKKLEDAITRYKEEVRKEEERQKEEQRAREKAEKEQQYAFSKQVSLNDANEGRTKERKDLQSQVDRMVQNGDYEGANKLVRERIDKYQKQMEVADKAMRNSSLDVSQRQNAMNTRNAFASQIDFLSGLLGNIGKGKLDNLKEEKSNTEKSLNDILGLGQQRLSDSLTNVGAGNGYFAQMGGIDSYVKDISSTLKTNLKTIVNQMQKIIDNGGNGVAVYSD